MESNLAIIENHFVVAGRRLDAMDMAPTRMVDRMRALQAAFTTPRTAPPQTFNMSTPIQPSQQPQPTAKTKKNLGNCKRIKSLHVLLDWLRFHAFPCC